ncbi:MAG: hypothetical protein C5B54_04085 [Acidobacteria bacterium]|nr:MAG: hypothetical protein C5B54_04085 [Acidobacteriota bacterium]
MNICIDMRPALSRATGVGVYLQNLVKALAEIDPENQYHLFSSSWSERYRNGTYGRNFHIHDQHWPGKFLHFAWNRFSFPSIESMLGIHVDVAHSPSPLLIPSKGARRVTTVHDLYFYFHPEHTTREIQRDYPALVKKHCQQSDAIIAVSEYTRQQLVEHLQVASSRIYTIRHGSDPFFEERASDEEKKQVATAFALERPFFLFVGAAEPRKNIPQLLAAFRRAKLDADLILAGPEGWKLSDVMANSGPRVRWTGYISRQNLRALYQQALALLLPSVEEGFGLPIIEAMACETPILASDIPVFHEIAQDAFLPIDTNDTNLFAEGLRQIYEQEELRKQLIEKGKAKIKRFSWRESAQKTLELYQHL